VRQARSLLLAVLSHYFTENFMTPSPLNRREFLSALALVATTGLTSTRAARRFGDLFQLSQDSAAGLLRRLPPVRVSPDRVIRTVAGLRPFRPSGFVVKTEKLGPKIVIHNYGHGGAGITLSWGTAALAVEEALKTGKTKYAVLGCGAVGLATARLLQRKGFSVTIYAKDLPPETTSNIAGGLWYPASVFNWTAELTSEFKEQFTRACRLSQRMFQNMVSDYYGVRWMEYYTFSRQPLTRGEPPGGADLYPETKLHQDPVRFFGFPYVLQSDAMMIEPHIYLNAVLRDFYLAGGKVVVREFKNRRELPSLSEPVIVNCTGLGSHDLFGDKELEPVKGQLTILLPQPEIDYGFVNSERGNLLYMFPRRDGIVLGGTSEHGEWSLDPNPEESRRILQGHSDIFRAT
jgi:glycine/D-amino acid oxidase-like deaminating enzyme